MLDSYNGRPTLLGSLASRGHLLLSYHHLLRCQSLGRKGKVPASFTMQEQLLEATVSHRGFLV